MSEKLAELASSSVASLIKIDLFGGGGGGGDKRHNKEPARPMTEVQVTGPETQRRHQQQAPAGQLHVDEAKSASAPTTADSSRKNDSSLLKPKTPSLLMRARNSTINLASLATVTNRFSCSASVGNLWHHGQQQQQQQHNSASGGGGGERHTAEPGEGGIQTLEYIRAGAFDSELPLGASETRPLAREPQSVKSASCHKLLGTTPSLGSGRKLSTKEKCKRQKEAERVEKLRLLVNYLKSGSGQPLVSPVALEADEIELAERYKLHMVLRDDLLANETAVSSNPSSTPIAVASGAGDPRKQQQQQAVSPSPTNVVAGAGGQSMAAGLASIGAGGDQHHQQHQHEHQHHPASHKGAGEGAAMGKGRMMISHSIGGTTASSPVSTSSGSMNHAHSTNDGRSIPHIGNVTWVLRHSISDPGNNFEHSPAFSSSSSSHNHHHHHHHHPAHDLHNNHHHHHHHHHHQHHHHHHNQSDMHANGSENIHNHSSNPFGLPEGSQHNNQSECLNCESCAPSSSYSGASLNNYCSAPAINKEALPMQPTTSSGGPPKTPQAGLPAAPFAPPAQPPKLFYIDDMDPLPTVAALPNGPTLAPTTSTPTIATTPAQPLLPPPLSASSVAVCSADRPSTCCSQPVTPAISTTSCGIGERNNSSSASTSAWSNAPNLASWIDNEVNSLVHDLEAKSQELSGGKGAGGDSKQAKGGKKKWLSVASGNTRRNSSGAQST